MSHTTSHIVAGNPTPPPGYPTLNTQCDPQLALLEKSSAALIQIDTTTMRMGAHNPTAATVFGEITGQVCYQRLMQTDKRCPKCRALEAYVTGKTTSSTVETPDGRWLHLSWVPARNLGGQSVIETIVDVTKPYLEKIRYREEIDRLEEQATTDGLTKLLNRSAWFRYAELHATRAMDTGAPVELLLLDIDHFKTINDTYSHQVGDKAIMHLGAILRNTTRPTDFVGRYGGEEFIVLLNPPTGDPATFAEQIRQTLEESPLIVDEVPNPIRMTISIGAAQGVIEPPLLAGVDHLIKQADQALYASKRAGRNRVTLAGQERSMDSTTQDSGSSNTFFSRTRQYVRRWFR